MSVDPWDALTGLSDRIKKLETHGNADEDQRAIGRLAERLEVTRIICGNLIKAVDWIGGMHNTGKDVWDAASSVGLFAGAVLMGIYSERIPETPPHEEVDT